MIAFRRYILQVFINAFSVRTSSSVIQLEFVKEVNGGLSGTCLRHFDGITIVKPFNFNMKRIITIVPIIFWSHQVFSIDRYDESLSMNNANVGCGCEGSASHDAFSRVSSISITIEQAKVSTIASTTISQQSLNIDEKDNVIFISGGVFHMGTANPAIKTDAEGPRRPVTVSSFYIDKFEVSNNQYREFIDATHYQTDSEYYGWSFVFQMAVPKHIKEHVQDVVQGAEWWCKVNGAFWREPEGPGTDVFATNRSNYAVTQISWNDANAYCEWRGGRLPTEAEWEYAARGGKDDDSLFPWGNRLTDKGVHRANTYQGRFPDFNNLEDGYAFASPVDAFPPQNEYGVYGMIGNVWEWVHDWWSSNLTTTHTTNPKGPSNGHDKVKKGGSFLCIRSYCYRYRIAARYASTPDSATQNSGFRCAFDAKDKVTQEEL